MQELRRPSWFRRLRDWTHESDLHRRVPAIWILIAAACLIGVLAGYGAALFTWLIQSVTSSLLQPFANAAVSGPHWLAGLLVVPAVGLLAVSWFTRRFAPEAQGHGVPEVIMAVTRHDGKIRARVSLMLLNLSPRHVKVLVAAGAAAGISATFNAPIAGVIFASEIEHLESLPVMNAAGRLVGIIGTEDLHRAMDSDIAPHFVYADDIASPPPISVSPDENRLEMLRAFGTRDVEMLPVEEGTGEDRRLTGLLIRAEVMKIYRREMLEP